MRRKSEAIKEKDKTELFVTNVCLSYRHDFGLLDKEEQEKIMFECKE